MGLSYVTVRLSAIPIKKFDKNHLTGKWGKYKILKMEKISICRGAGDEKK